MVRLFFILTSCILFSCKTNSEKSKHYVFRDLTLAHAIFSNDTAIVTTDTLILKNEYAIRLNLFPEIIVESHFSVLDYDPINDNRISSVLVTSNNSFSTTQPAGTSINNNFKYMRSNKYPVSIDSSFWVSNTFNDDFIENPVPDHIVIALKTFPNLPNHVFTVTVILEDGTTFMDELPEIWLGE